MVVDLADRERLFVLAIAELRDFGRRLVRDEDSLDDLVQDVALKLLEHPEGPADARSFGVWCRGVAWHTLMHRRRSFARLMSCLHALGVSADEIPLKNFERTIIVRDQLAAGVRGLDELSLRLLVERYVDGATSREIAARWRVSASSIRMRLSRLRSFMRLAAEAAYEDDEDTALEPNRIGRGNQGSDNS
jgi:RNA polymerase sigma factor (sigma-70 family)